MKNNKMVSLESIITGDKNLCDFCQNYFVHSSKVNEGIPSACTNRKLSKEEKQKVMNDDVYCCKGFKFIGKL